MILCISVLSVMISPFSFLILLIWYFSLFTWWVWLMVSLFTYLLKEPAFSFVDFAMVSFVSFAFICALIFKISFLLPTLGFPFLPFLVALGVELGYLFDFFLVSWGMPVLLWTFPLALLYSVPQVLGYCVFIFIHFYAYFDFFCDLLVIHKSVV